MRERKEEEKEVRGEHDGKKVEPLKKAFDSPLAFFESRWWSWWWWWCCIQQLGELLGEHRTFIHKISGHACYLARHSTAWYAKIPIALYCTVTFFLHLFSSLTPTIIIMLCKPAHSPLLSLCHHHWPEIVARESKAHHHLSCLWSSELDVSHLLFCELSLLLLCKRWLQTWLTKISSDSRLAAPKNKRNSCFLGLHRLFASARIEWWNAPVVFGNYPTWDLSLNWNRSNIPPVCPMTTQSSLPT